MLIFILIFILILNFIEHPSDINSPHSETTSAESQPDPSEPYPYESGYSRLRG
jgi:biopolymer transport protein ExbD